MKSIWIVNYYTTPPEYVSNPRHIEFAERLMKAGYDVLTFCPSFHLGVDYIPQNVRYQSVNYGDFKFIHIKARKYVGNGIQRMLSIFEFAWGVFIYCRKFDPPDVILHNIHAPFDYPVIWCKRKLHCKYIAEAWDLWPDSFVRFGLISAKNSALPIAYAIERKMYEKADRIVFTFEGGIDYLKKRHWTLGTGGKIDPSKISYINNGVNINKFNENKLRYQKCDDDLTDNGFIKIVYLGSVRLVNHVKDLIDAADILKRNPKYKFLIYGDGADRQMLEDYCKENNINNVVFKDKWMPLENVAYVISHSTINVMNYEKDFGIFGVSSGKLFQYLAAGKPILCNIKLNYCEITKHNLGIARDLDTPAKYAAAIEELALLDTVLYGEMCNRVLNTAKEYDYGILTDRLIKVIESC